MIIVIAPGIWHIIELLYSAMKMRFAKVGNAGHRGPTITVNATHILMFSNVYFIVRIFRSKRKTKARSSAFCKKKKNS